jgi:hypothetical protein
MINKSISLYDRGKKGLYLHPSAFTDMGVLIAIPPFVHLRYEEKRDLLWSAVTDLLKVSGGTVPHPSSWNQLDPLIEISGCKNWREFARNSLFCTVDIVQGQYCFTPGLWDGKGFEGMKSMAVVLELDTKADDFTEALLALFDRLSGP